VYWGPYSVIIILGLACQGVHIPTFVLLIVIVKDMIAFI